MQSLTIEENLAFIAGTHYHYLKELGIGNQIEDCMQSLTIMKI
jgi:hypothetical protein